MPTAPAPATPGADRAPLIIASVVAWWAAVILPGVLTLLGVFGRLSDGTTGLTGALSGLWIGMYCVQLGLVYVIGHALGHTRAWWFFVASLLPWVVDWATAGSVPIGLGAIAAAGAFAVLIVVRSLRTDALEHRGAKIDATVVKLLRNYVNVVINGVYIRRRVLVSYTLPDGTPQQRVLGMICEIGTSPTAGQHVALRVDPSHPRHVAIDPSELTS